MINKENNIEFNENEGKEIIKTNFKKTMRTLEILMNQMNMMYYTERLRFYF